MAAFSREFGKLTLDHLLHECLGGTAIDYFYFRDGRSTEHGRSTTHLLTESYLGTMVPAI
jgi:hypothetical protein